MPNSSTFLCPQQVVQLQTDKGYQKGGIVKQPPAKPQSYIVEAEGKEYHRNRRHLLFVPEPAPSEVSCKDSDKTQWPRGICHEIWKDN